MFVPTGTGPHGWNIRFVPDGKLPREEIEAITALTQLAWLDKLD